MSNPDNICGHLNDKIDDLITSVDAMRWTPAADLETANGSGRHAAGEPNLAAGNARLDALYERIDAFAGAVDTRLQDFATRVKGDFSSPGGS